MSKQISLRALTERKRQGAKPEGESDDRLPPDLLNTLPIWNAVARTFGQQLSRLLEIETTAAVELSVTDHEALRKAHPEPGLLLKLNKDVAGAWARFPTESARRLSDLFVRSEAFANAAPDTEQVDGFIINEPVTLIALLLKSAFGFDIEASRYPEPMMSWPLGVPPGGPRLMATFTMALHDQDPVQVDLIFADTLSGKLGELSAAPASQAVPAFSVGVPLSAVLGQWTVDAEQLSQLTPGKRIVIPGAALEAVSLVTTQARQLRTLATASLQTERGRHALRVTRLPL